MKKLLLLISSLGLGCASFAQVSVTASSLNYAQDFNTLDTTGSGLTNMPLGWSVYKWGGTSGVNTTYRAGTGTANTGDAYSYGAAGSTDRALGSLGSGGAPKINYGVKFVNNTGTTIDTIKIAYRHEQWRVGDTSSTNIDTTKFYYSLTGSINDSLFTAWTEVPSLALTSITTVATSIAGNSLNGNQVFDTRYMKIPVGVPAGGTLAIRFYDWNSTASDDGNAIDSFRVTFITNNPPVPNFDPTIIYKYPADNSTNIPTNTTLKMAFDHHVSKGAGYIHLVNESNGTAQNIQASTSSNVTVLNDTATISGLSLALGTSYHILVDSTAFDTAGYHTYGIYDTTSWNFSTLPAPVTSVSETFDASCATGNMPLNWSRRNMVGTGQFWGCSLGTASNKNMYITGYVGGVYYANEDWLITPPLDLSAAINPIVFFRGYQRYGVDQHLDVMYSTNYTGVGDPNLATWTNLNIAINSPADTGTWVNYTAPLPTSSSMYVTFKYTSSTTIGALVRLDSVVVTSTTGIISVKDNNQLPVSVLGTSSNNNILVGFVLDKPTMVNAEVYDLNGRMVYSNKFTASTGTNRISLNTPSLPSGMYIVRINTGTEYGIAKALID
jgi:hypothetical protein